MGYNDIMVLFFFGGGVDLLWFLFQVGIWEHSFLGIHRPEWAIGTIAICNILPGWVIDDWTVISQSASQPVNDENPEEPGSWLRIDAAGAVVNVDEFFSSGSAGDGGLVNMYAGNMVD